MRSAARGRFQYKDASALALWGRIGLYLCALIAVATAASSFAYRDLLEDIRAGIVTIVESEDELNVRDVSEAREGILALIWMTAFLATTVVTLMWTYRANANLRVTREWPGQFTPGWAVGWYFVPIAAFWMPYRMMKDLWTRSSEDLEVPVRIPWYFLVWWLAYNAMMIVGRFATRRVLAAKTVEEEIDAQAFDIAGSLLIVPAALLFARIIQRIQRMQEEQFDRGLATGSLVPVQDAPWR
jgi:hypothetical protein